MQSLKVFASSNLHFAFHRSLVFDSCFLHFKRHCCFL